MEVFNVFAEIEIDGTPISNYYSIQLSQSFNKHHEFSIKLPSEVIETKESLGMNSLKDFIGRVILIRFYKGTKNKVLNEFKGIIWDIRIEQFDAYERQIVLKGFSPTILLENNPHITCFTVKDLSKIVQETTSNVSSECQVQIKPFFKKPIKYLTQYKESNFEFLNRLSSEYGEWFFYDGKQVYFGKPSSSKDIELISGEDVYSLQLKLQILPMAIKLFTYQSDQDKTTPVKTPAQVDGLGQFGKFAAKESQKLFSEATIVGDFPIGLEDDIDTYLKIQKTAIAAELEVINGTSINPEIILGSTATVFISEKVKNDFSKKEYGKFLITSVTHEFTEDGKYINRFEGIPSTIEFIPVKAVKRPVADPQLATITDNNDPNNLGRVKVQMKWQEGSAKTDWIYVLTGEAGTGGKTGKNRGYVFIPEVGDLVVLGFYNNDPDFPFVSGSRFHGKSASGGGKDNKIKTISTKSGNTITLNDDKGSVLIEDVKGNSVLIDGAGKIVMNSSEEIELKTGDSSLSMKKDGTIVITGKVKVEIKSDQNVNIEGKTKVAIKSDQAVNIEGTQEVAIKGTNISAKANANLDLAANANLTAKANAQLDLEGTAMAKLGSSGMAEIQGVLVKIN